MENYIRSFPKKLYLKNGREIILRPMVKEDKTALLEFFRSLPEGERAYLRDDVANEEVVDRWVNNINYSKVFPLLAFYENKIIADGTIHRSQHAWDSHVGEIRLVVHPSHRRIGVGSILAAELFKVALQMGLDKIIASMIADDKGAVKVFSKLGFVREAVLKEHVKDRMGVKHDLLIMSNNVSNLLERFRQFEEEIVRSQEGG